MLRAGLPLLLIAALAHSDPAPEIRLVPAFPALRFERPVAMAAPAGSDRLYVVEQRGVIRVFPDRADAKSAAVFLDLRDRVIASGNEEGLLGLAFDPDFAKNGYFYVNYTAPNPLRTVIARFNVDPHRLDRAKPGSEKVILTFRQPSAIHNGGQMAFGPDGNLYVGTGDGGPENDPHRVAQNRASLLGKWLCLDVAHPADGKPYGIPRDNPFKNNRSGYRPEIAAYGLRNPWRFSYDPETRRWYCGDVGQDRIEEIDLLEKGGNFGWSLTEGDSCFRPRVGCDTTGLAMPIFSYSHKVGQCIIGGYVYRGKAVPALRGDYVYADFVNGRIWALHYDGHRVTHNRLLENSRLNIASFGEDANRELYALAFDGRIYRFR
ncbi:MAG TPA: PQQ-dependent sugar dehydrogenase [Oscillatoriaceae cyanobacterium]